MANKKKEIIEAAIVRISEQGDSFSTSQIADDVGCSQSLLFRYYRTKEGLMLACFDEVCHELMSVLKGVELPAVPDVDRLNRYAIQVWRAYCGYLGSNSRKAQTYLFFVSRGIRFPRGYRSGGDVLRRMLGDAYEPIVKVYPDFLFIAEYIIMFSYAAATGHFIVQDMASEEIIGKLEKVLMYGICGYGKGE